MPNKEQDGFKKGKGTSTKYTQYFKIPTIKLQLIQDENVSQIQKLFIGRLDSRGEMIDQANLETNRAITTK